MHLIPRTFCRRSSQAGLRFSHGASNHQVPDRGCSHPATYQAGQAGVGNVSAFDRACQRDVPRAPVHPPCCSRRRARPLLDRHYLRVLNRCVRACCVRQ
eukprot:307726-Rhodomonas_salina.1